MTTPNASSAPIGGAVAVSMILAAVTMMPLTSDRGYLLLAGMTVIILEAGSVVGRSMRLASWAIHALQGLVLLALIVGLGLSAARSIHIGGPLPQQLWRLYLHSSMVVQTESAPMPADAGVRWLMVALVGLVTILADILVITLESPVWSIAPILTLYMIPALAIHYDAPWWCFVLMAVGYLIVLLADQLSASRRWTRNLAADSAPPNRFAGATAALTGMGAAVAVPALVLALLLGSALPTFGSLDINSPRPRGSGPLQLTDPTLDLQKDLNDQSDETVIRYSTPDADGEYLRLASLTKVDSTGWHVSPVELSQNAPSSVPGLDAAPSSRTVRVQVGDFGSEYLPAPYAPLSAPTSGSWAWDPSSLALISTTDDRADATRGLSYNVRVTGPSPDPTSFGTAQAGRPDDRATTAVPRQVPQQIIRLTTGITAGKSTAAQKAEAIQAWLRDPRRFTYSTTAPPGNGYDVLTNFLTKTHSGYCIHFAAAMALMARIEGIPSRVSVGFLPGTEHGGQWNVRASNMHAWPELYFQGYGWVRFEPTAAVGDAPDWSVASPSAQPRASSSTSPQASPEPTISTSAAPVPSSSPSTAPGARGAAASGTAIPWGTIARIGIPVLVLIALCLAPMLIRAARRGRRLRAAEPSALVAGAWREVHDSWIDHGLAWPAGSPRAQLRAASETLDPAGDEALARLAMAEERARYAPDLGDVGDVRADVGAVRAGLDARRTPRSRLAARWLPASLWHRRG